MSSISAIEVLDFWFSDRARGLWFATDPAFDDEIRSRFGSVMATPGEVAAFFDVDDEIRSRFGSVIQAAANGAFDAWATTGDGALALTIILDQFARNNYRGTARAFEHDTKAREVADGAIRKRMDLAMSLERRMFLYLPFEHSEVLADQERSVELFSRWARAHEGAQRAQADDELRYVHRHHEIIRRFGRFPHRNEALGRRSTPEELVFLEEAMSSF